MPHFPPRANPNAPLAGGAPASRAADSHLHSALRPTRVSLPASSHPLSLCLCRPGGCSIVSRAATRHLIYYDVPLSALPISLGLAAKTRTRAGRGAAAAYVVTAHGTCPAPGFYCEASLPPPALRIVAQIVPKPCNA